MILSALRLLKVLSPIWLVLILTTIIIPGIVLSYLPSLTADNLEARIFIYIVWGVIVVYSVAFAVREDRAKANQSVDRKVECLSQDIRQTKDDFARTDEHLSRLVDRVNDMDSNMREGFKEIGVELPPREILLGGAVNSESDLDAELGENRSKAVRFCRWINRQARRLWKLLVG